MKRAAFAFDLDGTLVDSKTDIVNCVNYTLRYYGFSELPYERIVTYVGCGAAVLIKRSLGDNACQVDLDEAIRVFRAYYLEHCLDVTSVFDRLDQCLNEIKNGGSLLFVITNKPSEHSEKILRHFGIYDLLDGIFCQGTMKALKPDPVTIFEILERFSIDPQKFYMVGDSKIDMDFARSGGIKSIMVGYGGVIPYEEFISTSSDYKAERTEDLLRIVKIILHNHLI